MKRKYEIGFIINPEATEEDVKKVVDNVSQIITKDKGVVENVDEWGRKKMAYPINKHWEGIYVFINSEGEGATYAKVERRLKLSEQVMRFIILRLDDRLRKANRLTKKWQRQERFAKKPAPPAAKPPASDEPIEEVEEKKEIKDETN
jgi:small subunit ribosomal protein S6